MSCALDSVAAGCAQAEPRRFGLHCTAWCLTGEERGPILALCLRVIADWCSWPIVGGGTPRSTASAL